MHEEDLARAVQTQLNKQYRRGISCRQETARRQRLLEPSPDTSVNDGITLPASQVPTRFYKRTPTSIYQRLRRPTSDASWELFPVWRLLMCPRQGACSQVIHSIANSHSGN